MIMSEATARRQQFVRVCECGCGQPTLLSTQTKAKRGIRTGQPLRFVNYHGHTPKQSVAERFWKKVDKTAGAQGCWLWLGSIDAEGYGHFRQRSGPQGTLRAHLYAYSQMIGPIPAGMVVDHVKARGCTNRHCVNPAHLEAVTIEENTRRGDAPNIAASRQDRCRRGHAFTTANTGFTKSGHRRCRECQRLQVQTRKATRTA